MQKDFEIVRGGKISIPSMYVCMDLYIRKTCGNARRGNSKSTSEQYKGTEEFRTLESLRTYSITKSKNHHRQENRIT